MQQTVRGELRRLQAVFDRTGCREAIVLKQMGSLARREIAQRMGVDEETVMGRCNSNAPVGPLFLAQTRGVGRTASRSQLR